MTTLSKEAPPYSDSYRRLVLGLMFAAYAVNFIDRTIVASIGQAIKVDLKLSDTQLGLLGGLYFALLYTILGIPIARLAERFSRVNIIASAIVLWSAFTTLCGFSTSFGTLAACRFGVGVGEAGLTPPAHSLLSDYYEPRKRASALSVYAFGIPIGTLIGAVAGGWLAQHYSWRVAFMALGVPGVLIAAAIKLFVKEPRRGASEPRNDVEQVEALAVVPNPSRPSLREELHEIAGVIGVLFGRWPLLNIMLGVTLVSFGGYGGGQFVQPYFIRTFHLSYSEVGLFTGLIGGVSAGIGTLLGGFTTDRLAKSGAAAWYTLVPAIGVALSYPFVLAVYNAPTWTAALLWLALPGTLSYVYLGPTYGLVQNMFPTNRRATAIAVMFLFLNLIALGGGPPFTGWIIDHFAAFHLAHPEQPGTWAALLGLPSSNPRALQAACPGGVAPPGASAAAGLACRHAVQLATRQGVILVYGVGLWGAFHYLLASFGLSKALARARQDRGEGADLSSHQA